MILRGEQKATYKVVIISTGMRFISLIFVVLKASFLISCLVLINKFHTIVVKADTDDCTDPTTLFILNYVDEYLEYARKHNWISLSAVMVIAGFEIISVITLFILKKIAQRRRNDAKKSFLESLTNERN